ncbi:MAG: ankyrin repeat domain-containing protein, partial [Thermodesulfovibrionales bacterium]
MKQIFFLIVSCALLLAGCIGRTAGDKFAHGMDRLGMTAQERFFDDVKMGNVRDVESTLAQGFDVNKRDGGSEGFTPLIYAAQKGHIDVVRLLLNKGADVNARVISGTRVITEGFQSVQGGQPSTFTKQGTSSNSPDDVDMTAQMYASGAGHVEIVKVLLNRGAEVNARTRSGNSMGKTALFLAIHSRRLDEIVRILLDNGADVNARWNTENWTEGPFKTVLMLACKQRVNLGLVKLLVSRGADINATDQFGGSALSESVATGCYEKNYSVIQFLLSQGLDIQTCGANALWIAAGLYSNIEIVDLLLSKGVDINVQRKHSGTALIGTVEWRSSVSGANRSVEMVKHLLSKGADVNSTDNHGHTALWHATRKGYAYLG